MILPGCKARVLKRPNGEYFAYALEVDIIYQSLQENYEEPSFFRVNKGTGDTWVTELLPTGQVKAEKSRVVTVSDQYKDPATAAGTSAKVAADAPIGGERYIESYGFDMHFTPGKHKIGGLLRLDQARNADTDPSLHESALLLATTMATARKVHGVNWISEDGGSGVLTQAMRILKDKGVSFADTDHHIFFSGLTTRLVKAQRLASDIGMKFTRDNHDANRHNLNQWVGGLGFCGAQRAAYYRFQQDPEHTALKLGADLVNETLAAQSAAGTIGITTTAISAALGITLTGGSLGACIAFASAAGAIAGSGTKLWEAYFPQSFHKLKGKL